MKSETYLSTGEVAKFFSVTQNTVSKWIQSGKLEAIQTIGGHYRVSRESIERCIERMKKKVVKKVKSEREIDFEKFQFCWEYFEQDNTLNEGCMNCVVYQGKAVQCYKLTEIYGEPGYRGIFCKTTCSECLYYKEYHANGNNHVKR